MGLRFNRTAALSVTLAAALFAAACGSDQATVEAGPADRWSCEDDRGQIVGLLRSGLPIYDYNPAADLAALVETTDVVLSGTIESIVRTRTDPDADGGDDSWTVVAVSSPEVLYSAHEDAPTVEKFSFFTSWPEGTGADPLERSVDVDGMTLVAFLDRWEAAPGGLVADVQGIVVDCSDGTAPTPVIEPLPDDASSVSLAELGELIAAVSDPSSQAIESAVDTPEGPGLSPTGSGEVTVAPGRPVGVRQAELRPGEIRLWVSNQSFDDDPVHVSVSFGGVTVVDQPFDVEGQHNWIAFDVKGLGAGVHTITAESDTGASLTAEFTNQPDESRWLVLDYWYYPEDAEGRHFTFQESNEPVAFD